MTSLLRPALILTLGTLLAGCFNESDSSQDREGRIHLAMLQPPRSGLTPLSDDAFKLSRWRTAETLIVLDAAGDAQPGLATRWEPPRRMRQSHAFWTAWICRCAPTVITR